MKTVKVILAIEVVVFLVALMGGITGSSIGLNRIFEPNLNMDEKLIHGSYRAIRSDEWAVSTLLTIAQFNANIPFPQLNANLGVEGKKLAIAHDTGVPVKELSLLGKPATWGFFLFDLRRALSWYWLFPIFIALNGLWFLLNMVWPKQAPVNFCFSLYLVFSYQSVAWSFWPAWRIGVPCLCTALFLFILKNKCSILNVLASFGLGIFLPSIALILYYTGLIPVLTCLLLFVFSVCIKERLFKNIYEKKWYLLFAIFLTLVILFSWYLSNSDAISSMLSSTYPGQRRDYGGSSSLFREFCGWLDPILIFETFGYLNSSETATYASFILAIIPILLFSGVRKDIIIYTLMLYLLFAYCYMYLGIPKWLGGMSFWNRTTPGRVVIGVELCQVLIFSWLYAKRNYIIGNKYILYCSILMPLVISLILVLLMPTQLAEQLLNIKSDMFWDLVVCFILLGLAYFILMNKIKFFPYILIAITLPVTFFWNPLCIAPSFFNVEVPYEIKNNNEQRYGGRILSAVSHLVLANILAASGERVFNPTSHYVDKDIYNTFYKQVDTGNFKKFNHMIVSLDKKNKNTLASVGDQIFFNLNHEFDFSKFKADYMVTRVQPEILRDNKNLEFLAKKGGFFWYKIIHGE